LDAYAIRISRIELAELVSTANDLGQGWYRGDHLPTVLGDAVEFAGSWLHELPWFPSETELRSADFYVYPWSIDYHGLRPSAVELVFVRPSDKMVFFIGCKS
jgi:hypothetical protein